MKRSLLIAAVAATLAAPLSASAAASDEMAEVKRMIEQMKADYEKKIEALEQRLKAAEQKAETAADTAETAKQASAAATAERKPFGKDALTSGTAFNPKLSIILDGNYYHDDEDGEGTELLSEAFRAGAGGHGHEEGGDGHEHGGADNGFNFREAEIWFGATVDPYFDASATLAVDSDGDTELEEAFFHTRFLPAGLRVKAGKFFSDIGYINRQHPHEWDFTDQNLAHLNLFGFNLADTGVQVTWLPELPIFIRCSALRRSRGTKTASGPWWTTRTSGKNSIWTTRMTVPACLLVSSRWPRTWAITIPCNWARLWSTVQSPS